MDPADSAVALIRELEGLRTDEPETPAIWDRLVARGVDIGFAIVVLLALFAVAYVGDAWVWRRDREIDDTWDPRPGEVAFLAAFPVVWFATLLFNEISGFGRGRQSFGKRLLGIQVVLADNGGVPGIGRMLGRFVSLYATVGATITGWALLAPETSSNAVRALLVVGVLAAGALFAGREGRGVHDRLWGTRLVRPR